MKKILIMHLPGLKGGKSFEDFRDSALLCAGCSKISVDDNMEC